jgi:hypothetical protein
LSRSFGTSLLLTLALLAAAPSLVAARPHPTPAPSVTPSPPPEDPAITEIARREFVAWQAGVVERDRYSAETQGLDQAKINETASALSRFGALLHTQWIGPLGITGAPAGVKGYIYRMVCAGGNVYEFLTMGAGGKIHGIIFRDKLPTP